MSEIKSNDIHSLLVNSWENNSARELTPAQQAFDDLLYCRPTSHGAGLALNNNDCKPYELAIGDKNVVAIGMSAKSCRGVSTPIFAAETFVSSSFGYLGCRKGLPNGSITTSSEEVSFGAWILGFNIPLLKGESTQSAPVRKDAVHSSKNYFLGSSLCSKDVTSKAISYDENCPAYKIHQGTSATFAIGPIPITVEAGAEGQLGINHFSRVTPMWSNGRVTPGVLVTGYASAYVDYAIAKGGVEAYLTVIKNLFDVYGFSGAAYLPAQRGREAGFIWGRLSQCP